MKQFSLLLSLLISTLFLQSIQVSGAQSGNWTVANNPYQITGDVTVPTGLTLNVAPGVIVQAMGNFQIIAQGNIVALGTEQDSIKFGSGLLDQTTLWKGIRLENTTTQSQFGYCRIELGQYGIQSVNSPASIVNCHFNKNQKGIQTFGIGSTNPAIVLISHNLIEFSQHNGILVAENSNTVISNNDICHNGLTAQYYAAIQLSNQSPGGSNSPEIFNNHIHDNHKQGITAFDTQAVNAINPIIHDNLIENNLTGIYLRNSSGIVHDNIVRDNFIPGDMNSGAGIMVSGATAHPYFKSNIITGNYTGFYLTENANPVLGDLSSNNMWAQGQNQIYGNIDANNVRHTIACFQYTAATFTVKAENNRWDFDTAEEIATTITDFNDNPAFPTIDFDPWIYNVPPIYLAGTVTCDNPEVTTVDLQLISANTGLILHQWNIPVNTQFQEPVTDDSLYYIVAFGRDASNLPYIAAYGGLTTPIATQIIANVQFYIGEVALSNQLPNWSIYKVGAPETINEHLSYPVIYNWFVYAPTEKIWLFRDGDFLRISRTSIRSGEEAFQNYDIPSNPVWRKVANLDNNAQWQQFIRYDLGTYTAIIGNAASVSNVMYFSNGPDYEYDRIDISGGLNEKLIQLYDIDFLNWIDYRILSGNVVQMMNLITPLFVTIDDTLFPIIPGNVWKSYELQQDTVPTYFGYVQRDSLIFYWIPPRDGIDYTSYRFFDNDVLVDELPLSETTMTIPIPMDGIQHTYTLAAWDGTNSYFNPAPILVFFAANNDEVVIPQPLSVYPNPFNPANLSLTVKYDLQRASTARLQIYNLKGQLVWNTSLNKKAATLSWNGKDNNGHSCAAGLYHMQLTDNKGHKTNRKLMLIH
jgi:parallel beta-helix repeat protein